ncbi:hypothetical protein C8D90_101246 [Enterobacillus tribolii]|uniref:Uncharacterized protein n=1 Tax=Enterobacillus tribolii TaxID=1487935 RepID=A0A370R301_9GAMM|nr:hypothetical protein C8D90_101246 [Enterobacillus tribolii]
MNEQAGENAKYPPPQTEGIYYYTVLYSASAATKRD